MLRALPNVPPGWSSTQESCGAAGLRARDTPRRSRCGCARCSAARRRASKRGWTRAAARSAHGSARRLLGARGASDVETPGGGRARKTSSRPSAREFAPVIGRARRDVGARVSRRFEPTLVATSTRRSAFHRRDRALARTDARRYSVRGFRTPVTEENMRITRLRGRGSAAAAGSSRRRGDRAVSWPPSSLVPLVGLLTKQSIVMGCLCVNGASASRRRPKRRPRPVSCAHLGGIGGATRARCKCPGHLRPG